MKIVNCALLYADGDKYVWSVVTEGASEFPIDMELVTDGSIWENDGVKSVLTDGEWVAESSGGGGDYPVITADGALENLSCNWSYEKVLNSVLGAHSLGCIVEGGGDSMGGTWSASESEGIQVVCRLTISGYIEYHGDGTLEYHAT